MNNQAHPDSSLREGLRSRDSNLLNRSSTPGIAEEFGKVGGNRGKNQARP